MARTGAVLGTVAALVVAACGSSAQPDSSRLDPAEVGTSLTTTVRLQDREYEVRLTLAQALRGIPALASVFGADSSNAAPSPGGEYVVALVRFEYLRGPDPNTRFSLSTFDFKAVSSEGVDYDEPVFVIEPKPRISANLYPGASHEGWLVLQVDADDAAPLITFGRDELGRGGVWWKLPVLEAAR
ncbi:MAG: hypothetical protein V3V35_10115 [Dehalococcoidia bacterium]